jgi:hypothetical protein
VRPCRSERGFDRTRPRCNALSSDLRSPDERRSPGRGSGPSGARGSRLCAAARRARVVRLGPRGFGTVRWPAADAARRQRRGETVPDRLSKRFAPGSCSLSTAETIPV